MTMLTLDSPRWRELAQAHGSAEDIPRLLEALQALSATADIGVRAELWYGIWATLCPDGRLYDAAYAAVPHLLAMTRELAADERVAAAHVAAEVESLRHVAGAPSIPDDLVPAYAAAIESLPSVVAELSAGPWDAATAKILAAALLAGKRQPTLAKTILALGLSS